MRIFTKLAFIFVLMFGTVLNGFTVENDIQNYEPHGFNGVWQNGPVTLVINNDAYTGKFQDKIYSTGIIMHDENKFALISSDAWDHSWNDWKNPNNNLSERYIIKGDYIFQKNTLTISNIDGRYDIFNGIWKRQDIRQYISANN